MNEGNSAWLDKTVISYGRRREDKYSCGCVIPRWCQTHGRADGVKDSVLASSSSSLGSREDLEVIVNGQPVIVKAGTVREVISQAVRLSGQIGAPLAPWELRTTEGDVIPHGLTDGTDYELTPGRRLWLNLGLPVETAALPSSLGTPQEGWQPIETHDGSPMPVLVADPEGYVVEARFSAEHDVWWELNSEDDGAPGSDRRVYARHWMPLPAPPRPAEGETK